MKNEINGIKNHSCNRSDCNISVIAIYDEPSQKWRCDRCSTNININTRNDEFIVNKINERIASFKKQKDEIQPHWHPGYEISLNAAIAEQEWIFNQLNNGH